MAALSSPLQTYKSVRLRRTVTVQALSDDIMELFQSSHYNYIWLSSLNGSFETPISRDRKETSLKAHKVRSARVALYRHARHSTPNETSSYKTIDGSASDPITLPELDQMTMGLRGTKITETDTEMQRALETFAEVFGTRDFSSAQLTSTAENSQ